MLVRPRRRVLSAAPWSDRPRALILSLAAFLLTAAAILPGVALTDPAQAAPAPAAPAPAATASGARPHGAKPTIVFVHGAWADANGFAAEITTLTRRGYPVVTVANPLRGLTSDAAYVRARLQTISGPIVLVGHSYGGAVITNAAVGVANVKALVYLAAFSLAEGETVGSVVPAGQYPGSHLGPSTLDTVPVANPYATGGQDVDLYIKSANFADIFAGDVSRRNAAVQAATQRPLANTAYTQPSGPPAWASIPSWYLLTSEDHAIPPAGQRFMAERMGSHLVTVRSAHDVMISHPGDVDRVVLQAAAALR